MKANPMLFIVFVTTQVLGFSLLWSKFPDPSEQTITPDQFSAAVLAELENLKKTQQHHAGAGGGTAVVSFPQAETFRTAIRGILKEELAAVLEKQTVAANAAVFQDRKVKSKNEPSLTPEQVQQRETAMMASRTIIEQAIAEGDWSMEDVSAMTPYVNDLSDSQRKELIELYLKGMGDKALSNGVPPPPL